MPSSSQICTSLHLTCVCHITQHYTLGPTTQMHTPSCLTTHGNTRTQLMALHTTNLALYPIQWVKTLLISRVICNTGFIIIPRTLTMLRTRNSTFGTVWWGVCVLDLDIGIVSVCVGNAYVRESLSPESSYKRSVKYPVCRVDVTIIQHNTAARNIISRSTASQRGNGLHLHASPLKWDA